MRLIKPSFEIIEQQSGLDGLYKQIELAGRTCYKSEDKITENSAKEFVDRMTKAGHWAMLEHGTVYLKFFWNGAVCSHCAQIKHNKLLDKYCMNKYSKVNYHGNDVFVTTNLRVLVENGWMDDLKYLCEPTEYHEKRICVKFICDRGILAEFTRHRVFSFSAESTRYCNYSKDKFNNEVTFILPPWINPDPEDIDNNTFADLQFREFLKKAEKTYMTLLSEGWKPQQARAVLPNSLKTELVMTGFVSDWKHFFDLRDAGSAHPQAQELAKPLHEEFIKRNYI